MLGSRILLVTLIFATMIGAAAASPDATPFPQPTDKKGLQVQMVDDAIALGIHHAALNVSLGSFMDLEGKPENCKWTSDGKEFSFNRRYAEHFDREVKEFSDHGVLVYLILLAYPTKDATKDAILVHPAAKKDYGYSIAAFNTATYDGRRWLRALCEFLADRFSSREPDRGRVWGYIVGNEVNSHWMWYNHGLAPMAEVVADYEQAVRIVHAAVRRASTNARIYLSFDHHWTASMPGISENESTPGREFLDTFARLARERGDFDWHVATHPYPDDLGNPRTWLDKDAPPDDDAAHITFKNLEVMEKHMALPEMLYQGRPRRIILSEQGFHCLTTPDGESLQAAAFAYAWEKVSRCPTVDAFIWHRHVDHKFEGGLRLGLWERKPESVSEPGRKRQIYELFKAAGTPDWSANAAFALPISGLKGWDELAK